MTSQPIIHVILEVIIINKCYKNTLQN